MENQNSAKHDFSNRIVLVTGGTGALGRAITKAFVESNATVVSSYVNDREIEQVKTEIKSATLQLIKADITKEKEVDGLVSNIVGKHGRIDVLVNVVGGYVGGKRVSELDEKEWDFMMTMNLKSAFLISKHVV
jgi:NAD(P)-dependent dehydrogenase (short-subunit alcohol dehydrogenase family)